MPLSLKAENKAECAGIRLQSQPQEAEQGESFNPAAHGQSGQYSKATFSKPETKPKLKKICRMQFLHAPCEEGTAKQTLNRAVKTNKTTVPYGSASFMSMLQQPGKSHSPTPAPVPQCQEHRPPTNQSPLLFCQRLILYLMRRKGLHGN